MELTEFWNLKKDQYPKLEDLPNLYSIFCVIFARIWVFGGSCNKKQVQTKHRRRTRSEGGSVQFNSTSKKYAII